MPSASVHATVVSRPSTGAGTSGRRRSSARTSRCRRCSWSSPARSTPGRTAPPAGRRRCRDRDAGGEAAPSRPSCRTGRSTAAPRAASTSARRTGRTARRTSRAPGCRRASCGSRSTARWRAPAPPVRFQSSQESTVPNARSASASTPPSVSSHSSFVAEKYGSSTRPVRAPHERRGGRRRAARRSARPCAGPATRSRGAAARRCAGPTRRRSRAGSVMPIAATGSSSRGDAARRSVCCVASQISSASCSTQPGSGKCWVNSRYDQPRGVPSSSTANARTPVVPASMATITDIGAAGSQGERIAPRRTCTRCESEC